MKKPIVLLTTAVVVSIVAMGRTYAQTLAPPKFSPRVITVRPDGVEKTEFVRGERIVVLGEGFPKGAPAFVFFRQSSERLLATMRLTSGGTFRADVHVPFDAKMGPAVIRGATFGNISAVGQITVVPAARSIPTHDRDVALLGGGGIALVLIGSAMTGFVWWRRRRFAGEPRSEEPKVDRIPSSTVAKLREDVALWKKS